MQDDLIGTLLRAALEETAAQSGLLIESRNGVLRTTAEATRRHETIVVRSRDEVVSASLRKSVLDYVLRTRESVVIDATTHAKLVTDHDFRRHKSGSLLCLPLLHQAKSVGALLLESDLDSGIFTPARIVVLKLIVSLAASALVHARLCRALQEREASATRLADANIIGIYVVDLRGPILESNDAYLHMLGLKRADLDSGALRWTDLTPPEWHDADKRRVEQVKRTGRLEPFEKEFFRKDGTRVPVLMGVARFKGSRTQAVVFALDIARQKQAEAIARETRTIEQTRIARKMHDALLQTFQGMLYRFQAARNLLARYPDEALLSLNEAIIDGESALDESRNAIQILHSKPTGVRISR